MDVIKLTCIEVQDREEGFRVVYLVSSSNLPDSVSGSSILSFACGFEREFEVGKDYGLDLKEIKG